MVHGHKFAKLKPANHQNFSNSQKFLPSKITHYMVSLHAVYSNIRFKQDMNAKCTVLVPHLWLGREP